MSRSCRHGSGDQTVQKRIGGSVANPYLSEGACVWGRVTPSMTMPRGGPKREQLKRLMHPRKSSRLP